MHIYKAGLVAALTAVLFCIPVYAGTANDIRSYYGVAKAPDIAPIQAELNVVGQHIRTTEALELYNTIVSSHTTDEIDAEIELLSGVASSTRELLSTAVDMDLSDMLRHESTYISSVERINDLLQAKEVILGTPIMETDYDLQELYSTRNELSDKLSKATSYANIGDLYYYPVIGKQYKVNSNFGSRWDPITKNGYSYHSGLDLYAPMSTPIGAWFSGTVYQTGNSYNSGNYIWLDHGDGVRSFYCHLSKINVSKGQYVSQGTIIALSGNTGYRTTGAHLHLGLYLDGTAVDPRVVLEHA